MITKVGHNAHYFGKESNDVGSVPAQKIPTYNSWGRTNAPQSEDGVFFDVSSEVMAIILGIAMTGLSPSTLTRARKNRYSCKSS
jgi:hypothetical protein